MKKYKGIIFDLDGTLLDTIEDLGDSMNKVLEEFNFPVFSYEEYKLKVGGGIKSLVIKSFPEDSNEETVAGGLKLFIDYYDKNYLNKTKPYRGILEMLNTLKDKDIKLAVNSNKGNNYTNSLVEKYFSETPFLKVYGEREGVMVKPDPTAALQIAEYVDLKPEDILYIGDSNTDILTGKNAGMDTVGVIWGFRGKKELERYGASFTVANPKDILDIVLISEGLI